LLKEEENAKHAKEEREKARNSDFIFSLYIFYIIFFSPLSRFFAFFFSRISRLKNFRSFRLSAPSAFLYPFSSFFSVSSVVKIKNVFLEISCGVYCFCDISICPMFSRIVWHIWEMELFFRELSVIFILAASAPPSP
jgi:hypothetical protein